MSKKNKSPQGREPLREVLSQNPPAGEETKTDHIDDTCDDPKALSDAPKPLPSIGLEIVFLIREADCLGLQNLFVKYCRVKNTGELGEVATALKRAISNRAAYLQLTPNGYLDLLSSFAHFLSDEIQDSVSGDDRQWYSLLG